MSNYLGNASLSTAVKERVLSTFQQAITLFKQGRTDEVVQGCGLILRMDPMFDPAKKLLEKTRNPNAPIDVDALIPPPADDSRLREARTAMAGRDFQRVLEVTTEMLTEDLTNDEARILNEQAREKTEAAPFAEQFIRKAETLITQGNSAGARQELEKARALDDDHPGIRRVEQSMNASPMAASSSFIVEAPAGAPARKATQAADFGFTFEEEKQQQQQQQQNAPPRSPFSTDTGTMPPVTPPAGSSFDSPAGPAPPSRPPAKDAPFSGFSFDTPSSAAAPFGSFSFDAPSSKATPPPAPPAEVPGAAHEFDFSTADIVTSPDDQKKIEQYLADGDNAFDSGDYQQAIDLWSRIFLIDVTNDEASHRIEKAKARRREIEGKIESVLSAGVQAFDRKDTETARSKFNEVLQIDPSNTSAQDYLDRLNDTVTEGGAGAYEAPFVAPPSSPKPDIFDEDFGMSGSYDEPSTAPPTSAIPSPKAKSAAAPAPAKAKSKRGAPMGVIATILGVVVLAAAGWFGWQKFKPAAAAETAASQNVLTQAASLAARGQYDRAIAMLQNVKDDDPQHDKALQMIADLQQKKAQASEMVGGRPAADVYQEGLAAGQVAFAAHDYEAAKKAFDIAARIKPLPPDMQALYDQAAQQAAKLDGARALFKEQKFQDAITSLEQLAQSDPENASIKRMITDAHFNLGGQALQNDRLPEAIKQFDEVLKRDPNDELARRSRTLAERYNGQPKDLMYQIYVKYLPMRG